MSKQGSRGYGRGYGCGRWKQRQRKWDGKGYINHDIYDWVTDNVRSITEIILLVQGIQTSREDSRPRIFEYYFCCQEFAAPVFHCLKHLAACSPVVTLGVK